MSKAPLDNIYLKSINLITLLLCTVLFIAKINNQVTISWYLIIPVYVLLYLYGSCVVFVRALDLMIYGFSIELILRSFFHILIIPSFILINLFFNSTVSSIYLFYICAGFLILIIFILGFAYKIAGSMYG
jgi:hypothetical protein